MLPDGRKATLNPRPQSRSNGKAVKMKPRHWLILVVLALSPTAHALDPGDMSPFDKNPACMDINTDASTGNCIIQTDGPPRKKYPPPDPSSMPGNTLGAGGTTGTGTLVRRPVHHPRVLPSQFAAAENKRPGSASAAALQVRAGRFPPTWTTGRSDRISHDRYIRRVSRSYSTATLLGGPVQRAVMQAATAPKKRTHFPHLCPE